MKTVPKKAIWLTLLAAMQLLFFANLAASQELGERYEEKRFGISMQMPFGWTLGPVESDGGRSYFGPAGKDGTKANVNFQKEKAHSDLGPYVTAAMLAASKENKDLTVVSWTELKTTSKIPCIRIISTATIQGFPLQFNQYFFTGTGDDKFTVTFTAYEKDKTTNDKIFDLSAATFSLIK